MSPKLAYLAEVAAALQGTDPMMSQEPPADLLAEFMASPTYADERRLITQAPANISSAPSPSATPSPPPSPGMSSAYEDETNLVSREPEPISQGPAAPSVGVEPGSAPTSPDDSNAPPFALAPGGSIIPAREIDKRGPSLLTAQANRNSAVENTIDKISSRNEQAAQLEYEMALDQERQARLREAAMQQSIAERQEELAQRQADYDDTVSKLGRLGHIDPGRFWASRTTGQKIAGIVELMLSGMSGAPSLLMKRIDDDVKAQEFAYYATRDTASAQQSAFGMAMQKYQNEDAARAAARAAAIDVTQAQLAQISAKWKGTEAANRADEARANLQNEKMLQIQAGIQFMPAQRRGSVYIDKRTGLPYDLAGIQKVSAEWLKDMEARRMKGADVGGQIELELLKEQAKAGDNAVQLPNGQVIVTRSPAEADKVRGLAIAVSNVDQLVNRAKEIRSQARWWASPTARKELGQIQAELALAFKDRSGLSTLSGMDIDLAMRVTSDITSVAPGVDHALDSFQQTTQRALQNRVKTIPGAPSNAKGELSDEAQKSLKAYKK